MQLKALTRSDMGMTDDQCRVSNEIRGLRGGRELKTTQVANQVRAGRSCTDRWTGGVPARVDSYHGDLLCAGERVTQAMAGAWWWPNEAATKSWRRDLDLQVSSLVSGLDTQDDYSYPRGTLHRESTGRSWAASNTSNVYEVE
jgi:hypothetical protein